MLVDQKVIQFLTDTKPLYIHVAVSNANFQPYSVRGFGVNVSERRDELTIYILKSQSEKVLSFLTSGNGVMAGLFTDGFSNESYQIKGRFLHSRPTTGEKDAEILTNYRQSSLKLFPKLYAKFPLSPAICDCLTFKCEDIYIQTPGPYAGMAYQKGGHHDS